ncbi:MAG: hypothetical protein V4726_23280 [Verrucomicrobiota bacterium]
MIRTSPARFCFLIPAVASILTLSSFANTPLNAFQQDCHELSGGKQGENSAAAKLIIRSWLKGMRTAAGFNEKSGIANDPLNSTFAEAGDLAWCAGSLEKFILANRHSFPDTFTAEDMLPLWWISVHPKAEPRHREILRARLLDLKEKKIQSVPPH